jgi:hypothetical protein
MRFGELTAATYHRLPQLPATAITWLWFDDFWDGPLSGLVSYAQEHYWCQMIAERTAGMPSSGFYRRFVLLMLSKQELAEEIYWHDLFRRVVGTHTDGDGTSFSPAKLRPQEEHHLFYDKYQQRETPNRTTNICIGWFED